MKIKSIFILFFVLAVTSLYAADEDILIDPYYPSPKGIYDNVAVRDYLKITDWLKFDEDSVIELATDADDVYDKDLTGKNLITMNAFGGLDVENVDFSDSTLFSKDLEARDLTVDNNLTPLADWKLTKWRRTILPEGIRLANACGVRISCDDGFINSLYVANYINPSCIAIPIPDTGGMQLVLCVANEKSDVAYWCMDPL